MQQVFYKLWYHSIRTLIFDKSRAT